METKTVVSEFIEQRKELLMRAAELMLGNSLTASERALLLLGFSHGMDTAYQFNGIMDKVFKKD